MKLTSAGIGAIASAGKNGFDSGDAFRKMPVDQAPSRPRHAVPLMEATNTAALGTPPRLRQRSCRARRCQGPRCLRPAHSLAGGFGRPVRVVSLPSGCSGRAGARSRVTRGVRWTSALLFIAARMAKPAALIPQRMPDPARCGPVSGFSEIARDPAQAYDFVVAAPTQKKPCLRLVRASCRRVPARRLPPRWSRAGHPRPSSCSNGPSRYPLLPGSRASIRSCTRRCSRRWAVDLSNEAISAISIRRRLCDLLSMQPVGSTEWPCPQSVKSMWPWSRFPSCMPMKCRCSAPKPGRRPPPQGQGQRRLSVFNPRAAASMPCRNRGTGVPFAVCHSRHGISNT